jgi:ABC-type transport system involved in multi-copper enzyme maturation permease subunit
MITVTRITILECSRRRLLWALVVLTAVSVAITGWGFDRLVTLARERGVSELSLTLGLSQTVILVAFMFSFVLAMTAAFFAAPAVASDIESGVAQAMLARPLRRSELLFGKWLGLAIVIAGYAIVAGTAELFVVQALTGYGPPDPVGAVLYLAAEAILLLTLALVLGTRLPGIASGAIVVVVYGLTWVAGVLGAVGAFFNTPGLVEAAELSRVAVPIDGLWRGAVYSLEPAVVVAVFEQESQFQGNPFFAAHPPSVAFVLWSAAWIAGALGIGAWLLHRREI